jgi:hypothetical protein
MDLQELEKWITADEGKKWLEAQKKGLVDKNNELLEKVASGNAAAVQLNEKAVKLESDLLKANSTIREVLLSKPLAEKLKANGIFETLIPTLAETITKSYGLEIKTNGNDFDVMGKDNGKEQSLDQIIDAWSKLESSKECFKPQKTEKFSTVLDVKGGSPPNTDTEWSAMRKGAGLPEAKE